MATPSTPPLRWYATCTSMPHVHTPCNTCYSHGKRTRTGWTLRVTYELRCGLFDVGLDNVLRNVMKMDQVRVVCVDEVSKDSQTALCMRDHGIFNGYTSAGKHRDVLADKVLPIVIK